MTLQPWADPRKAFLAIASLGALVALMWSNPSEATRMHVLRRAWSLKVPWCCSVRVLEDVSREGVMLLDKFGPHVERGVSSRQDPKLVLWVVGRDEPSAEIPLTEFPRYENERPLNFTYDYPGRFRFGPHGHFIAGLQPPWVVLIDVARREEVRRRLVCSHSNPSLENLKPQSANALPERRMFLAVSPIDGSFAVACNLDEVTLHILDPTLKVESASWKLPGVVQDIAWSKHGELLAVLFDTPLAPPGGDGEHNSTSTDVPPRDTAVVVYQIPENRELARFNNGAPDAKVVFDGGGTAIFAIGESPASTDSSEKAKQPWLCEFQARTGEVLRRYGVEGSGPGQNFAVSPSGELIAARTAVALYPPFFLEQTSTSVRSGFVLLDAEDGQELYKEDRKTVGRANEDLPLFFTEDGKYLLVGYESSKGGRDYGEIVAYSLTGR